jgi:hypothetical protein
VASVAAGARIGQILAGHLGQAERVIEVPKGEQPGIGGDRRTVKLELEAAVEYDPKIGGRASPAACCIQGVPIADTLLILLP